MLKSVTFFLLNLSLVVALNENQLALRELEGNLVGTISLGSNLQNVDVKITTNSAVLWVPSSECQCAVECGYGKYLNYCKYCIRATRAINFVSSLDHDFEKCNKGKYVITLKL